MLILLKNFPANDDVWRGAACNAQELQAAPLQDTSTIPSFFSSKILSTALRRLHG